MANNLWMVISKAYFQRKKSYLIQIYQKYVAQRPVDNKSRIGSGNGSA